MAFYVVCDQAGEALVCIEYPEFLKDRITLENDQVLIEIDSAINCSECVLVNGNLKRK